MIACRYTVYTWYICYAPRLRRRNWIFWFFGIQLGESSWSMTFICFAKANHNHYKCVIFRWSVPNGTIYYYRASSLYVCLSSNSPNFLRTTKLAWRTRFLENWRDLGETTNSTNTMWHPQSSQNPTGSSSNQRFQRDHRTTRLNFKREWQRSSARKNRWRRERTLSAFPR